MIQKQPPLPEFYRSNRWFFNSFALFLLFAGLLLLRLDTGDLVLYFSNHRSAALDFLFIYGTQLGEPIAFFLSLALLLFVSYRYAVFVPFVGLSVTFLAYYTKRFFDHDRPLAFFEKMDLADALILVEGIKVHSGPTSFPSGHTMAGFALFAFLAFCLPKKWWIALLCFCLALITGLSRIYLTQHFLKDVYLGSIMGVAVASFWYYLCLMPRWSWLDGRLKVANKK